MKGSKGIADISRWQFYKDSQGQFHWRKISDNGTIITASPESFKTRDDCVANARLVGYRVT